MFDNVGNMSHVPPSETSPTPGSEVDVWEAHSCLYKEMMLFLLNAN